MTVPLGSELAFFSGGNDQGQSWHFFPVSNNGYSDRKCCSAMGAPPVPAAFKLALRHAFNGPFILAGGFDAASAQIALNEGQADMIAFARASLANPDLVKRLQ